MNPCLLSLTALLAAATFAPAQQAGLTYERWNNLPGSSLETLRRDATEPVILRKAAIARIGRHGGTGDLATLGDLQSESHRVAQAATPARQSIQDRIDGRTRPDPVPYPAHR